MGRKSSVHIEPRSIPAALLHNARVFGLSYAIDKPDRNEDKLFKSVSELKSLLPKIKADFQKHSYRGRKMPSNSTPIREAVFNLDEHHTLEDLERAANVVCQKLGVELLSLSLHLDEGKIDEDGNKKYNYHGHALFNYYDFKTHKIRHNPSYILEKIQTEVAEVLGMERGISKKETRRKHLSSGQYRAVAKMTEQKIKEAKAPLIENITALKKEITALKNRLREANKKTDDVEKRFSKDDYHALDRLKKISKKDNFQEVLEIFLTLRKKYLRQIEQINDLKKVNAAQEAELNELKSDLAMAEVVQSEKDAQIADLEALLSEKKQKPSLISVSEDFALTPEEAGEALIKAKVKAETEIVNDLGVKVAVINGENLEALEYTSKHKDLIESAVSKRFNQVSTALAEYVDRLQTAIDTILGKTKSEDKTKTTTPKKAEKKKKPTGYRP